MNPDANPQCDVCKGFSFKYGRYKCLRCHDYDLCLTCFQANAFSDNHVSSHPMQLICSAADSTIFYGREAFDGHDNTPLTCPFCGELGFTKATLMTHLTNSHMTGAESATPVLCPMCVIRTPATCNFTTCNLPGHLAVEHQVPGPTSLTASLSESAMNALRNSRRTTPPRTQRSGFTRRNQTDELADLMENLSNPYSLATVRERPDLHHFHNQARHQQRHQQVRQQSDYQRLARRAEQPTQLVEGVPPVIPRHSSSRVTFARNISRQAILNIWGTTEERASGAFGRGNPLIRMATLERLENVATAAAVAASAAYKIPNAYDLLSGSGSGAVSPVETTEDNFESNQNINGDDRFLLKQFLNPVISDAELVAMERERADRSLFTQALLLSALSKENLGSHKEDQ